MHSDYQLSPEQLSQLVSIRNWVLEAAIEELDRGIVTSYDLAQRRKVFAMLNDVVKLAKSVRDLSLDSPDSVFVLPDFGEGFLEVKRDGLYP